MIGHPLASRAFVARALSACGHGASYALGAGGYSEKREWPWHDEFVVERKQPDGTVRRVKMLLACDCTGFLSWALGIPRKLDAEHLPGWVAAWGAWLETSNLVRDAQSPWGWISRVPWRDARPGMIMVYGDSGQGPTRTQGHVGIISEMDGGVPQRVVHCSSGSARSTGDAIRETGAAAFLQRGIAARFAPNIVNYDDAVTA